MIGKKKLSDARRELTELLEQLPKELSGSWIQREIQTAEGQAERDAETMKMLRAALQQSPNPRRLPARCLGCPATNGIYTPLFLSPTS